jgi:hypothetical protein
VWNCLNVFTKWTFFRKWRFQLFPIQYHMYVCILIYWFLAYWLGRYAPSWKVAGSNPDYVINFFNLRKLPSRIIALRLTQPRTEISAGKYFWGVESGRCVRLTNSLPSVSRLSGQCDISTSHNLTGLHNLLQGYLYSFYMQIVFVPNRKHAYGLPRPVPWTTSYIFVDWWWFQFSLQIMWS